MPVPSDNRITPAKVALGRRLYYDPILSVNYSVSCANCHNPKIAFANGERSGIGVQRLRANRNVPTLLNVAFAESFFWDGRAATLEKQVAHPVSNDVEMASSTKTVEARLNAVANYRDAFANVFGPGPITFDHVASAIASFERTLISGNSAFDRYYYGGDRNAMSPSAIRGLNIFMDAEKTNCASCHTMAADQKFALFTDKKFHNVGIGVGVNGKFDDAGRSAITHDPADEGAFKTPSLRNVAKTAPYMHDGSLPTLADVVDYFARGGNRNAHLDPAMRPLSLTAQERADLVAFLESLTGELKVETGEAQDYDLPKTRH